METKELREISHWETNAILALKKLMNGYEIETSLGILIMADNGTVGFKLTNKRNGEICCVNDLTFKQIKDLLKKDRKIIIP